MKRAQAVGRLPDYVVVEGPLAGGHLGFGDDWAEYNLEDIVRDVVKWIGDNGFDIPVFAAGGIFSGEDVGAAGVQVATRFAVAQESGLPEAVKQRYIDATDDDVQVNHFSTTGYPMRMLKDSPAITSDIRPNCEAYGYLLQKGECSYVNGSPVTARLTFSPFPNTPSAVCARTCATSRCGHAAQASRA